MATESITVDGDSFSRTIRSGIAAAGHKASAALRLMLRTTSGRIALPIVLLHVTLVLVGPWLAPYSITAFQYTSKDIPDSTAQYEFVDAESPFLDVTDASQFGLEDVIVIDDERMLITEIADNTLTVVRGYGGSTAAVHPKLHQLEAPSWKFWLGTDQFGRDMLSRVMSGARSLILMAGSGTILGIGFGPR